MGHGPEQRTFRRRRSAARRLTAERVDMCSFEWRRTHDSYWLRSTLAASAFTATRMFLPSQAGARSYPVLTLPAGRSGSGADGKEPEQSALHQGHQGGAPRGQGTARATRTPHASLVHVRCGGGDSVRGFASDNNGSTSSRDLYK